MSKHTQGPWTLETVQTSCGICHKIGPFPWKDGKQNHACIYADYPGTGPIEKELLANARLIAAAPDLLKACSEWIVYLDSERAATMDEAKFEIALLNAMREAISKATQP